jgi:Fic family protein
MYRYTTTDEISTRLLRFEELRKALDEQAMLPRAWYGHMRRELEAEAVGASVSMEGIPVTVDEVRRILAGDRPDAVSSEDADLVVGYREAMRHVLSRADDPDFRWESEVVRGIHERVLAGSWVMQAGRYRQNQNRVVDSASRTELYVPPSPEHVPALVDDLVGWLGAGADDQPAPIAAALAHVRLAGIHPFADGNGRTARIIASLVMYRGGYRLPQFTSLEEWWGRHLADYYAAFSCLGTEWDPAADVTPFVSAHVLAQCSQAEALSLRQSAERELWLALEDVAVHAAGTDARSANALYEALMGREVTNRYYRSVVDVAAPTAASDLARLDAAGLLERRGSGRSTAFVGTVRLVEGLAAALALDLDLRGASSYDGRLRDALLARLSARSLGHA